MHLDFKEKIINTKLIRNHLKTEWKRFESNRVCSIYFAGGACEAKSVPNLKLGDEVNEKKVL